MDNTEDIIRSRRLLLGAGLAGAAGLGLASTLVRPAAAQEAAGTDTFERMIATGKLRIAAANLEPYYFKDITNSDAPGGLRQGDVTWRGMGIAIGLLVAEQIGVQLEVVETTWQNGVATLQADQADVMFYLDGTPKRATAIDFLPTPVSWSSIGLLVRDDFQGETWADVDSPDFAIAVGQGGSPETFIKGQLKTGNLVAFPANAEGYAAFQSGRVQAIGGSGTELALVQHNLGMGKVFLPKPAIGYPNGAGIRYEAGGRFRAFMTTAINYLYFAGKIEAGYRDFMAFRGIEGENVLPIMRERWG
ncbi:MAG: transporter substrate-binding domain-containing protein [Rhodobacteraceae bacterium]|nr:transporter substrate-binding domain-containing protein [Paracoccaceae bacterium]